MCGKDKNFYQEDQRMNIFKWLTDKAGKVPVTLAQAAGLTAVVGAAGFAALSYLNAPVDNTTTFMPPSQGEEVVFVSQNAGGGSYESNGEVGSAFKAAPSRAIQLANQQALREQQAQALEDAAPQTTYAAPPEENTELTMPKAANLGGADFNLGLGGSKDVTGTFDALTSAQNQLKGMNERIQTQIQGAAAAAAQGGPNAGGAAAGQPPAEGAQPGVLASAPRNWGKGGSGGSGGGSNAFVIQNSNKNTRSAGAPGAEVGDAIAQAQAAMNDMREGTRLRGRASFGKFDGNLGDSKDATVGGSRRLKKMGNELTTIRKQSADIAKSRNKAPNAGAAPFLASARISGGLTVNGDNITIGQSSSGDLSQTEKNLRGIKNRLKGVGEVIDQQNLARSELKSWLVSMFTTALAGIVGVAVLVKVAKSAAWPWNIVLYALAGILTALTLFYVWRGTIDKAGNYADVCGSDGWTTFAYSLAGIMTAGLGAAWIWGPSLVGKSVSTMTAILMPVLGFGSVGFGISDLLTGEDGDAGEDVSEGENNQ